MTDADVDGAHIRTLLLTLFYRYFPQLIQAGNLYIAQPPLFRVQKGKDARYVYNEAALEIVTKELAGAAAEKAEKTAKGKAAKGKAAKVAEVTIKLNGEVQGLPAGADAQAGLPAEEGAVDDAGVETVQSGIPGVSIQRYKGLGEMNPEQLWETTMDPARRVMRQVTVDDAEKADEVFDILMGSDVAPRKRFIHTQAKYVKNLDI